MKSIVGVVLAVCLLGVSSISCTENTSEKVLQGKQHYSKKEYSQAVACFREAAEKGDAEAQLNLGVCYSDGHGVTQDHFEAVKWFRKSADQGNAEGQVRLGLCYYGGFGVAVNKKMARDWWRKAEAQGGDESFIATELLNNFY